MFINMVESESKYVSKSEAICTYICKAEEGNEDDVDYKK